MIFLIEYDPAQGTILQLKEFLSDALSEANTSRLSLELERMQSNVRSEIVILEADSEEHLRKTHRRYFEPIGTLADPDTSVLTQKAA